MAHHRMSAGVGEHTTTGGEISKPDEALHHKDPTETVQYWTDEFLKQSQELRKVQLELDAMKQAFAAMANERDAARGTVITLVQGLGGAIVVPKEAMEDMRGKRFTLAKLPQADGGTLYMTREETK